MHFNALDFGKHVLDVWEPFCPIFIIKQKKLQATKVQLPQPGAMLFLKLRGRHCISLLKKGRCCVLRRLLSIPFWHRREGSDSHCGTTLMCFDRPSGNFLLWGVRASKFTPMKCLNMSLSPSTLRKSRFDLHTHETVTSCWLNLHYLLGNLEPTSFFNIWVAKVNKWIIIPAVIVRLHSFCNRKITCKY